MRARVKYSTAAPIAVASTNTLRQPAHSTVKPPRVGANIGTSSTAVAVVAIAEADLSTPKKSEIAARATAMAAPAPKACSTRAASSVQIDGAIVPATLPAMNSPSPARMTGRRPKRSESGATTRLPSAMDTSDRLTSSCVVDVPIADSAAMAGSDGSSKGMPKGPGEPMAADATISRLPCWCVFKGRDPAAPSCNRTAGAASATACFSC